MNCSRQPAEEIETAYRTTEAAAWVRACFPDISAVDDHEQVAQARQHGLDLHMFKRVRLMPRVMSALGLVKGLAPTDLLDIGTGRGSFLWPLLDDLPELPVTCVDLDSLAVERIEAVAKVRQAKLRGHVMDVTNLDFDNDSFDCVTFLETLEHIPHPETAMREALRVARRWLVLSVPSEPDENPEHIHLFTEEHLRNLVGSAGGRITKIKRVPGHWISLISPSP